MAVDLDLASAVGLVGNRFDTVKFLEYQYRYSDGFVQESSKLPSIYPSLVPDIVSRHQRKKLNLHSHSVWYDSATAPNGWPSSSFAPLPYVWLLTVKVPVKGIFSITECKNTFFLSK